MARTQKDVVSYFPHDSNACDGDTLTVLQNRFGNDGYAFWFKLLEKLSSTEGHCIDCSNSNKWQLLLAKTGVNEITGVEIMKLLVETKAIDKDLWDSKLIWCQKLVDNFSDVYKNRRRETPQKPLITEIEHISASRNCATCGKAIEGMRGGAKYCSTACRQKAFRVTDNVTVNTPGVTDNVTDNVTVKTDSVTVKKNKRNKKGKKPLSVTDNRNACYGNVTVVTDKGEANNAEMPITTEVNPITTGDNPITTGKSTQSKVKKSTILPKGNISSLGHQKEITESPPPDSKKERLPFYDESKAFLDLVADFEQVKLVDFAKLLGRVRPLFVSTKSDAPTLLECYKGLKADSFWADKPPPVLICKLPDYFPTFLKQKGEGKEHEPRKFGRAAGASERGAKPLPGQYESPQEYRERHRPTTG